MKLNIGNLYVKDVQLAQRDAFEDGILYINKDAAVAYLKDCDEHITDLDIVIARPGDDTRIVPVIETMLCGVCMIKGCSLSVATLK